MNGVIERINKFIYRMKGHRKLSLVLLSVSAIVGLIRGYRMAKATDGHSLFFAYPREIISDSVFSNYAILGWILFFLVGVFSILTIVAVLSNIRIYAYLIIIEGIFCLFFGLTNLLLIGFSAVHLLIMPMSITLIVVAVLQTPREF